MRTIALVCLLAAAFSAVGQQVPKSPNPEKFPVKFLCKHCGIPMTAKRAEDWKKRCNVCPCAKTLAECRPTKGVKN